MKNRIELACVKLIKIQTPIVHVQCINLIIEFSTLPPAIPLQNFIRIIVYEWARNYKTKLLPKRQSDLKNLLFIGRD